MKTPWYLQESSDLLAALAVGLVIAACLLIF